MSTPPNKQNVRKVVITYFLSKGRQVAVIRTFAILTYSLFLSTGLWFGLFYGKWNVAASGVMCLAFYTIGLIMAEHGEFRFSSILRVSIALTYFIICWHAAGGLGSVGVVWASSLILGIMWASGYWFAAGLNLIASGLGVYDYARGHASAFNLSVYLVNNQLTFFIGVLFKGVSDHYQAKAIREKKMAEQEKQKAEAMNSLLTSVSESEKESASCFITENGSLEYPSKYFRNRLSVTSVQDLIRRLDTANCNEVLDCFWTTMGSNELTWTMNDDLWPKEAIIDGDHHILTWLPIYNQNRDVSKVYFEATNDEKLQEAQQKSAQLSADAEIIMHMIHIGGRKVCDFLDKSRSLLLDSQNHLANGEIRLAQIALHTIKGAARTLNFDKLSERLHDTETAIEKRLEVTLLLEECCHLLDELFSLADKLGFSNDAPSIDLKLAESAIEIGGEREFLQALVYRSLESTVLGFQAQLVKIAKELHKEPPNLIFAAPKVFLRKQTYEALDTALLHVFRNAMDHGIESPDERVKNHKKATGTITVSGNLSSDGACLVIQDDGRGLALQRIREKARERGILRESRYTPNEIAECIFSTGFSTASSLTLTSGRGIGMDAVRGAIERIGGSVKAEVLSEESHAPWILKIFLPRESIISSGYDFDQRRAG